MSLVLTLKEFQRRIEEDVDEDLEDRAAEFEEAAIKRKRPFSLFNARMVLYQVADRDPKMLDQVIPYENILTMHDWNKLGRKVKKGAEAYVIGVLQKYKKEVENKDTGKTEEKEKQFMKAVGVFGFWQTEPFTAEAQEKYNRKKELAAVK